MNRIVNASAPSLVFVKLAGLIAAAVLSGCATTGALDLNDVMTDAPAGIEDLYRGA
jgi:hypothetical protein